MEDTTPRGPVTASTRRTKQLHGARLLEQESARLQLVLLRAAQSAQREVGALEVVRQHAEGRLEHLLNSKAVLLARASGQ